MVSMLLQSTPGVARLVVEDRHRMRNRLLVLFLLGKDLPIYLLHFGALAARMTLSACLIRMFSPIFN